MRSTLPLLLLALPLLLPAVVAFELHSTEHCNRLAEQYQQAKVTRNVYVGGRAVRVVLYHGSAPACAGAALLQALLTHVLHYEDVQLAPGPHRLVDLVRRPPLNETINLRELAVAMSGAWAGEHSVSCKTEYQDECWAGGPRLRDFGPSTIPARVRLHLHLAGTATPDPRCALVPHWLFSADRELLSNCSFLVDSDAQRSKPIIYYLNEEYPIEIKGRLVERAVGVSALLSFQSINRSNLFEKLTSNETSLLFLDYDIWKGDPRVVPVGTPPCAPHMSACREELDPSEALRAVDSHVYTSHAPHLFNLIYTFRPTLESLRSIMQEQAKGMKVEEAACKWALNNSDFIKNWTQQSTLPVYRPYVLLCDDDPDKFDDLLNTTYHYYNSIINLSSANYRIGLKKPKRINCSDPDAAGKEIHDIMGILEGSRIIGIVAGSWAIPAAATLVASHKLPLLLYDAAAEDADTRALRTDTTTWSSAGSIRQLALALHRFASDQGWTRLAVFSDDTLFAKDMFKALKINGNLTLRQFAVASDFTAENIKSTLADLRDADGRIVFLNTGTELAAAILSVAINEGMAREDKFAWIVREWLPRNVTPTDIQYITVSFWCHNDEKEASLSTLRKAMNKMWPKNNWPARAVALVDAVLTLAHGFHKVLRGHPEILYDLPNNPQYIERFAEVLSEGVGPVEQDLRYEAGSRARVGARICVQRRGVEREQLGECRVRGSRVECQLRPAYPGGAPDDGASRCVARAGDAFSPRCYDATWITVLVLLVLIPPVALLSRRTLIRHLAHRDHKMWLRLLTRHQRSVEALATYLVARSALEQREELGNGRFGLVRLALLRVPGRPPNFVAAKALREGAAPSEESDFMREACILAALEHEHIVRLVGVCVDDGPPLVLMEYAFFGDLLRYLRARRHLAETTPDGVEEAAHVAPEALTRLAREAASALGYLALRGLVHRDVRAANCLVDARRSLKLADFGMAREIAAAGADGAAEYACRRRALFPVLWMAPESLARGVFSAASDVWGLGVLLLELVTLGERPYGDMSPLRVLQYVAAGGRPPLPPDATPQTRGVALACWQRDAEQRPTAAELVSYLAAHPRSLRAALRAPRAELTDADSGYGEPSSPDLLAPDICLYALDSPTPR